MLSEKHISIVKSTVPLLESAGTAITEHFYKRMFAHNPELKNIFNMSHQHSGGQPAALFNAVAAYAKNIDNLGALSGAVERIAHKHTSFNIQPEHYPIVGHHLLETLRELAPDAFTPDVEEAWGAAYGVLAGIFIDREATLYHRSATEVGGWQGARKFEVIEKTSESELVTSFVLAPEDGEVVIDFESGQYLGVSVAPINHDYQEMRQYSLSDKPNGKQYRISVKREAIGVPGVVSNYLHDHIHVGDSVDIYPPAGDFHYEEREAPVVLISAGVGVTPMQSMLEMLASKSFAKPVFYLHACEGVEQHSFNQRVEALGKSLDLQHHTWYRDITKSNEVVADSNIHQGFMNFATVRDSLPIDNGDYYLCGPVAFMQFAKQQLLELGVKSDRIHYEVFGPHASL
ncbi:NO-inducible flavohemoprotein [Shewanella sp. Choline-02u-19]|jgi:nitric oxide dioxygenase|uniref:NO-inducible flavohemoprotein n=1 Tax=unclassified Shewanella TaxID=196818 RepID=UPI000C337F6D|nr:MULTISPECIES: NO-inducible flavohemoprotein [unclassified Shewanella]PKG56493.1 NO-inducible flavohemoprotein [Shewanella sp. GutDb-MelDb]PKG74144.1 NO-inducible flavohemoprotein [Shewanella sp. GutCb]PKH56403.1 NO-inducible flavohemoprotein [Shewanella sp. Bg11-22]PKI30042.1 NO-inducible flavohemoprotein [Shewanella sp. Choline-02u-19]